MTINRSILKNHLVSACIKLFKNKLTLRNNSLCYCLIKYFLTFLFFLLSNNIFLQELTRRKLSPLQFAPMLVWTIQTHNHFPSPQKSDTQKCLDTVWTFLTSLHSHAKFGSLVNNAATEQFIRINWPVLPTYYLSMAQT